MDHPRNLPPPGLDETGIAALVDRFYERIRQHPQLGPVFEAVVDDWPAHKRLLTGFWCSVALRTGRYRGNPMAAHRPLPLQAAHFTQWLELWRTTTAEVLDPVAAARMQDYAERIGHSLRLGLGLHPQARPLRLPLVGE